MGKLLLNGVTRSCGCYRQELMTKHGLSRTKIYRTWSDMRSRCHNPNDTGFKNYGERGIAVCDEWRNDFVAFYEYVSKLEHFGEEGYSLDRINVNGNYEPGNLRWATDAEQRRNRTDNHYIEINGEQLTVKEIASRAGVHKSTINNRLKAGMTGEDLLKPAQPRKFLTAEERAEVKRIHKAGDSQFGVRALATRYGVSQTQIRNILNEK